MVLVFYLIGIGLSEPQTGMLLTLTLAGDTVVSLFPHDPRRPDRASPHWGIPVWSDAAPMARPDGSIVASY